MTPASSRKDTGASKPLKIEPRDLGTLLVCSVRYSIGRRTYMPSLVADHVMRYWRDLDAGSRATLLRDVEEAIRDHDGGLPSLGDACDETVWRDLEAFMRRESL